ncbi:hypothetical protein EXIGLDRAFT_747413 [Exidia glandulosa HHB12029]|uniref:Uncharacterized protein n=1 Tax=Exidia glandulosa HHB12029 TaxID=1314781 RepID=A0A165KU28_EXIGL|nr:hypothetical protein EXIGLDRAFT_747413 [Exidia glandulosa HHB12029]
MEDERGADHFAARHRPCHSPLTSPSREHPSMGRRPAIDAQHGRLVTSRVTCPPPISRSPVVRRRPLRVERIWTRRTMSSRALHDSRRRHTNPMTEDMADSQSPPKKPRSTHSRDTSQPQTATQAAPHSVLPRPIGVDGAHTTSRHHDNLQLMAPSDMTIHPPSGRRVQRGSEEESQHSASPHASDSDALPTAPVSSYGRRKTPQAPLITRGPSPDEEEHDTAAPKPHRIHAPPKSQPRSVGRVPIRVPADPADVVEPGEPGADVQGKRKKAVRRKKR